MTSNRLSPPGLQGLANYRSGTVLIEGAARWRRVTSDSAFPIGGNCGMQDDVNYCRVPLGQESRRVGVPSGGLRIALRVRSVRGVRPGYRGSGVLRKAQHSSHLPAFPVHRVEPGRTAGMYHVGNPDAVERAILCGRTV